MGFTGAINQPLFPSMPQATRPEYSDIKPGADPVPKYGSPTTREVLKEIGLDLFKTGADVIRARIERERIKIDEKPINRNVKSRPPTILDPDPPAQAGLEGPSRTGLIVIGVAVLVILFSVSRG